MASVNPINPINPLNPISASCQSIASTGRSASTLSGGTPRTASSASTAHYIHGMGSLGRIKYHYQKQRGSDGSDEEFDVSQLSHSTHVLERVKSDRFLSSRPDEDRRRRTIIVEKKNGTYGFTLQSYGIHYKKEQEIEMITYVDYVEYDGPAYKAGMREGDVILYINGTDMEQADHKTLVDFIQGCDGRMRMVVLFEDCVRKVELHMRYIQLQNALQGKMNELERICLRERELLEGKWRTHSLPARKKAATSPTDAEAGLSPTDAELQAAAFYRPALSTEDVANTARHQQLQQAIIPPPAQYMLTYHYLNPSYRYVLKPSMSSGSGEYFVAVGAGGEQHFVLSRTESADAAAGAPHAGLQQQQQRPPATSSPRTCEKHKPTKTKQQAQEAHLKRQQQTASECKQKAANATQPKSQKSGRHCHGHSCNPCIGHFRWKSADKAAAAAAAAAAAVGGDNVSLDAYDLASPCCDTHCVPSRRRSRHGKEHTHKHKHRDRDRDREPKECAPRPKSAMHASPSHVHHVHHQHHAGSAETHHHRHRQHQHQHQHQHAGQQQQQQQQQQPPPPLAYESKTGSLRSRYYDLTAGLASHCSLHSCTSSEFAAADSTSYTTSLSTDTLYWDQQNENPASRQHSTKSRQSCHQSTQQHQPHQPHQPHQHAPQPPLSQGVYQQRYHIAATQVQPSQIYPNISAYAHKPKSWDNLATKTSGGYGFGYGYLDTVAMKPAVKLEVAQQRHSMPRKNSYGRYSTYTDVENYAPPPSQFVEELTTTTTTMITTKSADDLLSTQPTAGCDCASKQQQQQQQLQLPSLQASKALNACLGSQNPKYYHQNNCHAGYYSRLPRPTVDAGTSTTISAAAVASNTADVATVSEATRL